MNEPVFKNKNGQVWRRRMTEEMYDAYVFECNKSLDFRKLNDAKRFVESNGKIVGTSVVSDKYRNNKYRFMQFK